MSGPKSQETGAAHHGAGISLLSMATLLLELSWTRVLSMILGLALGFRAVLAFAAVCYLVAWAAVLVRRVGNPRIAAPLIPPDPPP
jgi:hypothetical protein